MKLFSLMVLLCASLGGYAQDIKGRVVEQENGKKVGLPGANVYWAGTTDGVVTDAEGHFKINAIPVISSTNVCNICLPNFNIVCKYILFL